MNIIDSDEQICQSQCLTGKCPFKKCVKYKSRTVKYNKADVKMRILRDSYGIDLYSDAKGLGIAFDIGTTTVVGALYEMAVPEQIAVVSGINRQYVFGYDVISRIKYCIDNTDGMTTLHNTITHQLNEMLVVLCADADIDVNRISRICITGNTLMLHLLLDYSPKSMGTYPFEPDCLFGFDINAEQIGLNADINCYIPPCASAFIGADIIGGLTALNFDEENNAAFMDIGTNGEVAAIADKRIYASATAAGPAFEGVHITYGMAAVPGAISEVKIKDGNLSLTTIDNLEPKGLTGSGLTDAIASFVKLGEIEYSGKITPDAPHFTEFENSPALRLTGEVIITQKDIREFQTAKAALCAGIITLIKHANFAGVSKNQTLFLAGGFGNYLNIENAEYIGLLPDKFNIVSAGNTSLTGAALLMMNKKLRIKAEKVAAEIKVFDLSVDKFFMEKYVGCMSLTSHEPI